MRKSLLFYILCFLLPFSALCQINTNRVLVNGRAALFFDDYVLSIQYFNQVIEIKPHLSEPYYYRAVAKIQLEDFMGAETDCSKALELNPFMPAVYYARGFAYKQMGNYKKAASDFTKALEFSPENEHYLINRIEAFEKLKEFDKALEDIDLLQSKKTSYTNLLWIERGSVYLQQEDTTKAYDSFNTAIAKDSTNPEFWGARAIIYLMRNDNKLALYDYNKAIQLKSKNIGHYINRGILNFREKNYKDAISDYNKAVELDSTNKQALFNRGLLRSEVGDFNNAISDFSKILLLDDRNDEALFQRGILSLTIKDYKQAKNDFNKLIEKYPYFVPAFFGRADAESGLGNIRQATIDRYHGHKLMVEKDSIQKRIKEEINTREQIAKNQASIVDKAKSFDNSIDINNRYNDKLRGPIQNNFSHFKIKKNYDLTYYSPNDNLRRINNFDVLIEEYNQTTNSTILISNNEAPLNQTLINYHFNKIIALSDSVKKHPNNKTFYLERGINYALVQNQEAALEDFNQAINLDKDYTLAYFCRANILYKIYNYELNIENRIPEAEEKNKLNNDKDITLRFSLILRDYNKVLDLTPNFPFAWFNRGNTFYTQKDYKNAIKNYTEAIAINNNFAEAYFNRGINYILNNEKDKGLADLSKAGELGIYHAYNLIKRFQE